MSRLDDDIDRKADALARLDDKRIEHVHAVLKYSTCFSVISGALFAASIYGIHAARTNAGEGVAWFAAALTGIAFVSTLANVAGIIRELYNRRKRERSA